MFEPTVPPPDTSSLPFYRFGFRTKVTVLICTLVLATWGSVSFLTSNGFKFALVKESLTKVGLDAELAGVRLSSDIQGFADDLRFLARTPPVQGIIRAQAAGGIDPHDQSTVRQWKDRLSSIFREFLEAKPEYVQLRYIGVANNGRELVRVDQSWGFVESTKGVGLQEKGEEVYFQDTIRQPRGTIYFSDITLNREHGEVTAPLTPTLRIATPVYTASDEIFGIIVVNINMSYLFSRLHRNLKLHQILYVTNSEGEYLVHPNSQLTFGFDFGESHRIQNAIPDTAEWLANPKEWRKSLIYNDRQEESVMGLARTQLHPKNSRPYVIVGIQDSYRHVLAAANSTQQETILLSVGLLFLALIGALFLSRSIIFPLKEFSKAAGAVGQGSREIRFPIHSEDEVGQLAMAFNTMAMQIEERTIALERKEKLFRYIVESAPNGIVMVNQQGIIGLTNELIAQQFGYTREEVTGQPIEMLIPERFRASHIRSRTNFFASLGSRTMGRGRELFGQRKDGTEFPVEVALTPMITEEGPFTLATVVDITERKQAQEALMKSEARNRLILESAGEGIYGLDLNGQATFVNPAGAAMLGYAPEELIGVPMHSTIHHTKPDGSPYPQEECPMYAAFLDGTVHHVEDECLWRKDGTIFPVAYRSTPIRDDTNAVIGAVVTFSDITNRKESEQALLKWTQALETSNRELDDFAYIASHDLKEPLRGIHNYSKILLEDHAKAWDDEARTRCETVLRLSRHMETLIDSLLYFSRVGRSELAIQPTNLESVLGNILESLDVSMKEHGIFVKIPQGLPTVACDGVRTGEIFRNLITNAIKYNDKPEKWIEIGYLEDEMSSPSSLIFYVRDNGIGIREKHLSSIFRIFKRLHGRDKFGGGTGVGLTMTKKMVERHGGRIWVESIYGEGTTFYFTLSKDEDEGEPFLTSTEASSAVSGS